MPTAFVLAGILGSELEWLSRNDFRWHLIWVSYANLARGEIGVTRLDDMGISPGRPDGRLCRPLGLLPDYFGPCVSELQRQMSGDGWDIIPFPYDWRKRIQLTGASLASAILTAATPDDPCAIVAHSMGGLVARFAWRRLGQLGKQDHVRRIVTLGTPHWGSYEIEELFSGVHRETTILQNISIGMNILAGPFPGIEAHPVWTRGDLIKLYQTWPGAYDLLPNIDQPNPRTPDSNRAMLYDASLWPPARRPSQFHLNESKNSNAVALTLDATTPPASILTCVRGTGTPTKARLPDARYLGTDLEIPREEDGDGTVTVSSAYLFPGYLYEVIGTHQELPNATARSGDLARWITEVHAAPAPPPGPPLVVPLGGLAPIPFPNPRTFGLIDPGPAVPRHDC